MLPGFIRRRPAQRVATTFGWLAEKPFARTETADYGARYERGAYLLELRKAGYFAWEPLAGDRQYSDFSLRGEVGIDPSNGHSAVGFLLRYRDEENFYSFLVSRRGLFRFDLLRNNHPVPLIEWTVLPAAPEPGTGERRLRVIAHGSRFTFSVDDEWVGEIDDETIASGSAAFAAQNFEESERGNFRLRRLECPVGWLLSARGVPLVLRAPGPQRGVRPRCEGGRARRRMFHDPRPKRALRDRGGRAPAVPRPRSRPLPAPRRPSVAFAYAATVGRALRRSTTRAGAPLHPVHAREPDRGRDLSQACSRQRASVPRVPGRREPPVLHARKGRGLPHPPANRGPPGVRRPPGGPRETSVLGSPCDQPLGGPRPRRLQAEK